MDMNRDALKIYAHGGDALSAPANTLEHVLIVFGRYCPIIIDIDGADDPIRQQLSVSAWNVLMAYYFDPIRMVADVLDQELRAERLAYDDNSRHLMRAEGGCSFCRNDDWTFAEPCAYGKEPDPDNRKSNVDRIVRSILAAKSND